MDQAPLILALAVIAAYVIVTAVSFLKFKASESIRVLSITTPVLTAVLGAASTYYFQRREVHAAEQYAGFVQTQLRKVAGSTNQLTGALDKFVYTVDTLPSDASLTAIKNSAEWRDTLESASNAKTVTQGLDLTNEFGKAGGTPVTKWKFEEQPAPLKPHN